MPRIALVLLALSMLTACPEKYHPFDANAPNDCEGGKGIAQVNISYGDSKLWVKPPVIDVTRKAEIRFQLLPEHSPPDQAENAKAPRIVDNNARTVTITSQDDDAPWLTAEGSKNGNPKGYLKVCVEGVADRTYKYDVEVEGVGKLDPRVRVF